MAGLIHPVASQDEKHTGSKNTQRRADFISPFPLNTRSYLPDFCNLVALNTLPLQLLNANCQQKCPREKPYCRCHLPKAFTVGGK